MGAGLQAPPEGDRNDESKAHAEDLGEEERLTGEEVGAEDQDRHVGEVEAKRYLPHEPDGRAREQPPEGPPSDARDNQHGCGHRCQRP